MVQGGLPVATSTPIHRNSLKAGDKWEDACSSTPPIGSISPTKFVLSFPLGLFRILQTCLGGGKLPRETLEKRSWQEES